MYSILVALLLGTTVSIQRVSTAESNLDPVTEKQLASIGKIREILKNEFPEAYMTEDYYLANWLIKRDFNEEATVQLFREYLEFRKEHNLGKILDEEWEDMRLLFPYIRTTNRQGSPLIFVNMGDWDVCGYLTKGESEVKRFVRYLLMFQEESEAILRELRAGGKAVGETNPIFNAAGFSYQKHGCVTELHQVFEAAGNSRAKFASPNVEKVNIVNVPFLLKGIFALQFSQELRDIVNLYGQDQHQWEEALLKYVQLDQFPEGFFDAPVTKDNSEGLLNWKMEL